MSTVLDKEPGLRVVATARNGAEGLEMFRKHRPDLVTLDIMMPVVDGLETLSRIRETDLKTPVIMFSSLTGDGATATMDALSRGANDYVLKPSGIGKSMSDTSDAIQDEMVPKIRALVTAKRELTTPPPAPDGPPFVFRLPRVTERQIIERRQSPPDVLAIGVSAGGPEALHQILPQLPSDFPIPILVIQHMPALFTRALSARLDRFCKLSVREAADEEILEPGTIYFAPGDYHLTVKRDGTRMRAQVLQTPPINSCRPSVDALFQSVARVFGRRALSLVLTGMGKDGLEGCKDLRNVGATIYVQDKNSSVIWGMPGHVARANLANKVVPLERMVYEIVRTANRSS